MSRPLPQMLLSNLVHLALRNMFLNYVGKPSVYLPTCMILSGVISIMTGALRLIPITNGRSNTMSKGSRKSKTSHWYLQPNWSNSELAASLARYSPVSFWASSKPPSFPDVSSCSANGTNVVNWAHALPCSTVATSSLMLSAHLWLRASWMAWRASSGKPPGDGCSSSRARSLSLLRSAPSSSFLTFLPLLVG